MSDVEGLLLINKPSGLTSAAVARKIGVLYNVKKVGHGGTLDPLADGLLVVLLGQATHFASYQLHTHKCYQVTITFGASSDTDDAQGTLSFRKTPPSCLAQEVEKIIPSFLGEQTQFPPIYSAIKYKGKKLYEYARQGQIPKRKERLVYVNELDIIAAEKNDITIKVACSAGFYVRSLARDMGECLGCGGYVSALKRVSSGDYDLSDAHHPIDLENLDEEQRRQKLLPMESLVSHLPRLLLPMQSLSRLGNGVYVHGESDDLKEGQYYCLFSPQARFAGIGQFVDNELRPVYCLHWTRQK